MSNYQRESKIQLEVQLTNKILH